MSTRLWSGVSASRCAGLLALTGSSAARAERSAGLDYDDLRPCRDAPPP